MSDVLDAAIAAIPGVSGDKTVTVDPISKKKEDTAPAKEIKIKMDRPKHVIFRVISAQTPSVKAKVASASIGAPIYLKTQDVIRWAYKRDSKGNLKPFDIHDDTLNVNAEGVIWQPRTIRYVHGEQSIFVDEQNITVDPDTKRHPLLDNPANRDALVIVRSEKKVNSDDTTVVNFLHCMGQCENQHPYARRAADARPLYRMLDFADNEKNKVLLGQKRKKCYEIACTARESEMIPHAKYLGIPLFVAESGQERDLSVVREDYKDKAYNDPELFERSYNDPRVKLLHWIRGAHSDNELSIGSIAAGKAHWVPTQQFICDLPTDQDPFEFLSGFAMSEQGKDFGELLRSYNLTK